MELYKYMKAVEQEDLSKKLKSTLELSRMYFSDPKSFNDPFEGFAFVDFGSEEERAEAQIRLKRCEEEMKSKKNNDPKRVEYFYRKFREGLLYFNEFYRVACLTSERNNELMWAHYADSHKGVCLQYTIDTDSICDWTLYIESSNPAITDKYITPARVMGTEVIYEKRPYIKFRGGKVSEYFNFISSRFYKNPAWAYEKEYRIIAWLDGFRCPDRYTFCEINRKILTGIIFGVELPSKYKRQIIDLINQAGYSDVKFEEAYIDSNTFSIQYKGYKPDEE